MNKYSSGTLDNVLTTNTVSVTLRYIVSEDEKCKVRIMIWDTEDQEMYRSANSFYYRDTDAAILVYDIINPQILS